jgi:type VI secretion system lysozyme-like protein
MQKFVAAAPLFDQLMQEHGSAKVLFTRQELLCSIQRELSDIFETRSSFSSKELDWLQANVPDESFLAGIPGVMGFPATSTIFIEDPSSWGIIERRCELMIRLFEPRLASPRVKVDSFEAYKQRLILKIQGSLVCRARREIVSFELFVKT